MNIRSFALLPLALTLACGPKDAPVESAADSDAAPAALTGADIAGRWASGGCEAYDDGQGGQSYLTRDFTLTADTWTLNLGVFGDAACTYALFTAEISGPYSLGGLSEIVAGATEGDFAFGSIVWTAQDQGLADTFTSAGCGAAAWEVGVPQDVSATGCIGVAHPVAECPTDHDVVALVNGQLFFGERVTDMCQASGRPQALGPYGLDPR